MIGSGLPTPEQKEAAALVAAMIVTLVRPGPHSSTDDVAALSEDLRTLAPTAEAAVGIALQTSARIIDDLCISCGLDPVTTMQEYLTAIRSGPTRET